MAPKRAPEPAPEAVPPPPPPFYVADVPLPVADEMGAETVPVRAFNPGDRVPPEHVERFGWAAYVHDPFAPEPEDDGPLPAGDDTEDGPPPEPAPDDPAAAQATTDEAGQPGTEEQ